MAKWNMLKVNLFAAPAYNKHSNTNYWNNIKYQEKINKIQQFDFHKFTIVNKPKKKNYDNNYNEKTTIKRRKYCMTTTCLSIFLPYFLSAPRSCKNMLLKNCNFDFMNKAFNNNYLVYCFSSEQQENFFIYYFSISFLSNRAGGTYKRSIFNIYSKSHFLFVFSSFFN